MKGTLYGIGVGPGDPRLMTYLAVDTIKRCPVIAVPADGKGKAVAYKIASGIVEDLDTKECLNLSTPMTKDKAILDAAYQTAADTIIEQLEQDHQLEEQVDIIMDMELAEELEIQVVLELKMEQVDYLYYMQMNIQIMVQ